MSYAFPLPVACKSWRQRHPILFWGGIILVVFACLQVLAWATTKGPLSGPKIGVVRVEGVILDSTKTVKWIEKLRVDPLVKGVLLRINSPGGAVEPSEEIYMAVLRLAKEKPVVVSMGALAASGGYYIALGGEQIFSGPSSITASIGVKLQVPNAEGLMRMIGISAKTITTGGLKDAGSPMREMSPEEEAYFRTLITDMYDAFVDTVAARRNLPRDTVVALADGRAMTGRQALKAGLVDRIGDFHDALTDLTERCKLPIAPAPQLLEEPKKSAPLLRELLGAVLEWQQEQQVAAQQIQFMY